MSTLANNFTDFLSKVEQMENDNEKLNKDIQKLEKERAEGWKKFNTDTHVLMEREELENILNSIDDMAYTIGDVETYTEEASSAADSANSYAYDTKSSIRKLKKDVEDMISPAEKEEVAE